MKSFKNGEVSDWSVVLNDDTTLRKYLPMNACSVVNNTDDVMEVYLHGGYVGTCYGYSTLSVNDKPYDTFRIVNVNGETMVNEGIEVIVSKTEVISTAAYNPGLDFIENNFDKFALRCDKRMSYDPIDMPYDKMVYILNASAERIVQRRIDIEGDDVNFGQYKIVFDDDDVVSGAIPVGGVYSSEKRYRKTLTNKNLAVTLTDAVIRGWIVDYKEKEALILPGSYSHSNLGYGNEHLKVFDYDVDTFGNFPNNYQNVGNDIIRIHPYTPWVAESGAYKMRIAGEAGVTYRVQCDAWTVHNGWKMLFQVDNSSGVDDYFSGGFNCPWEIQQIYVNTLGIGAPTKTLCEIYDISLY